MACFEREHTVINLYLIRHGETAGNVRQLIQGVTNSRLDAHGRKQAFALGLGLKKSGLKFDRVVSSDLIRAQETAQQILLGMDEKQPIETNSGLREENDGIFEGRELKDVSQEVFGVPDYHQLVTSGKVPLETIPDRLHAADVTDQAENTQQIVSRYDLALRRIVAAAEAAHETSILVVSHGTASLLWLLAHGADLPNRTELTNASVSKVTYQNGRFKVDWVDNTTFRDQGLQEAWSQ